MRKTLKRQALESIIDLMKGIADDYKNGYTTNVGPGSEAMRNLAEAFTLVKRGVMLPDYGREKDE